MREGVDQIEVFQELRLSLDVSSCEEARQTLEESATNTPWQRVKDVEKGLEKRRLSRPGAALVFRRDEGENIPAVILSLWLVTDDSDVGNNSVLQYKLGNIVPEELHQLDARLYNDALEDFQISVVNSAESTILVRCETTPRHQTLASWTSEEAAKKLRYFSSAAPKHSALGHPSDEERWRQFVSIAYDSSSGELDPALLRRWLVEVDQWPEELASELATDWDRSRNQLKAWTQYCIGKSVQDRPESLTN